MITRDMNNGLLIWGSVVAGLLLSWAVCFTAHYRRLKKKRKVLLQLLTQDQYEYILVDLRDRRDYETSHIPGALNRPKKHIRGFLPTENMFETIFVYGYGRADSRRARRLLGVNGYFNVHSFGSFRHWKGPLESSLQTGSIDAEKQGQNIK